MRFAVEPAIWSHFPGLHLAVAVASGIDNGTGHPGLRAEWEAVWTGLAAEAPAYENAQSHPRVRPWRDRFQALGVSGKKFPSSIEALVRRVWKGGGPWAINPLVDFYNAVSLRHVVPAGGFDLAECPGDLELRLSRPGDTFQALDEEAAIPVPPGEVTYAVGSTVLTRHFVWRQARTALITPETREVFLVSEILGDLPADVPETVLDDFDRGLRSYFGAEPRLFMLDESIVSVSW